MFEGTIRGAVNLALPPIVAIGLNCELNRVVASGDSRDVPLELLDLIALVESPDGDSEEEADKDTSNHGYGHLLVLGRLRGLILNAGELHEESSSITRAGRVVTLSFVQRIVLVVEEEASLANGGGEGGADEAGVGLAGQVAGVRDASVLVLK